MTSGTAAELLPRRRPGAATYRIGVVCLGNICRSPMADVVLNSRLADAGLADRVEVLSSGTGDWHVGGPMDRRAAALLTAHGYDATRHRAQQFGTDWFDDCDLILAMDSSNLADLTDLGADRSAGRVRLFRDFDPRAVNGDRDVPDPYYGGDDGFEPVLAMIDRTATALVAALPAALEADDEPPEPH
jgi:protein-tyrosine phosphatase